MTAATLTPELGNNRKAFLRIKTAGMGDSPARLTSPVAPPIWRFADKVRPAA